MRAQGNTWVWQVSFRECQSLSLDTWLTRNQRLLAPGGLSLRGGGREQKKVRGEEDTCCAFHDFPRLIPSDFIWKMSRGHYMSRIWEVCFFFFNFWWFQNWLLECFWNRRSLLHLIIPQTNPQPVLIVTAHGHLARLWLDLLGKTFRVILIFLLQSYI